MVPCQGMGFRNATMDIITRIQGSRSQGTRLTHSYPEDRAGGCRAPQSPKGARNLRNLLAEYKLLA